MVFGHGHPITTGAKDSIDYFISSSLFEPLTTNPSPPIFDHFHHHHPSLSISSPSSVVNDVDVEVDDERHKTAIGVHVHRHSSLIRVSSEAYTEQFVLFDSMSAILKPVPTVDRISRDHLESLLSLHGFYSTANNQYSGFSQLSPYVVDITQNISSPSSTSSFDLGNKEEEDKVPKRSFHVYSLLQHSKKINPKMDSVIKNILMRDQYALIIVLDGMFHIVLCVFSLLKVLFFFQK